MTEFGKPFSVAGFSNRFRKWCNEAGLPHCSAHGLRKAGSARLAELGASDRKIMGPSDCEGGRPLYQGSTPEEACGKRYGEMGTGTERMTVPPGSPGVSHFA